MKRTSTPTEDTYAPVIAPVSAQHAIRGVPYQVTEWGDRNNPLLVMLHGFGDAGTTFQFVVDQLQKDWFVIAPDWRGFGDSYLRAESYWFPDYLADLDALLSIYSPDKPVNLLGHSMGGNIAGLFAGIFPERVARFINVEGFGMADRKPADAPENYRKWIEAGKKGAIYRRYDSFDELAARISRRNPHTTFSKARFVAEQWAAQDEKGKVTIKADPAHKLPNAVQYRRSEAEACWQQVSAPVLIVIGAESNFGPGSVSWLASDAASLPFKSATTCTIQDAGHMVHFDQPAALAKVVENFFSSVSQAN
jgi:pimeloyl-ACP methyl ester carboxylesterase